MRKFRSVTVIITIAGIISVIVLLFNFSFVARVYHRLKREGILAQKADMSEMAPGQDVMIALTLGQSNAANYAEHCYTPHNRVLNYAQGKLYVASDPLVGADGNGGSVWGVLGDMLIDSGKFKKVIFVPIGVGNTWISLWSDGYCYDKLVKTLQDLDAHHVKLTHIFWHQGEADVFTPKQAYKDRLAKIVATFRQYHQNAPFYCSIASYHPGFPPSQIAKAQTEFITENYNVLFGANTDTITNAPDRYQGVHFSESGVNKYARSWFNAINQAKEK